MPTELRVLLVEDSEDDAALVLRALRRGGFEPVWERVETAEGLRQALAARQWELVLSDYAMSGFNGMEALRLKNDLAPEPPFVLVSGAVGEETATEIMRAGARDYVMKDRLGRLVPVVARELEEAKGRAAQRQADKVITALVHGIVATTGEECFERIIEGLCGLLDADAGMITVIEDGGVRSLACYMGGKKKENFFFKLAGSSPAGMVLMEGYQFYPRGVRALFPEYRILHDVGAESYVGIPLRNTGQEPIGTLCIMSSRPMQPPNKLQEIMEILAVKAASEIERRRAGKERLRLAEQLRQAQKMEAIGTLAGGIAHDFNNILAAIMGYTEIAIDQLPRESDPASCLQEVLKATHRAKGLVQQILAFSRKSELERGIVRLDHVVRDSLKLLRATIPTTIDIQQLLAPDCWPIVADENQMHQVLINLGSNAGHAMEEKGGTLTVLLQNTVLAAKEAEALSLVPGDHLLLVVSDTGDGMAPEVRARIFDPYFTTKEQGKGAGMGLSVVHGIVKSHGGAIAVQSEAGQGATFRIFFPRARGEAARGLALELQEGAGFEPNGAGRIMVVDDEEALVALQKLTLSRQGYQITSFTESEEALRAFSGDPQAFDLVITDQTMPHLSGAGLAKALRAIRPDLPIILCSGYSAQVSEADAEALGVSRYLMKPVDKTVLVRAVREVLGRDCPCAASSPVFSK